MNWLPLIAALMTASFFLGRKSRDKAWLDGYFTARNMIYLRPMALRRK